MSPNNDPSASNGATAIPVRTVSNEQASPEIINMEIEHNIPVRQFGQLENPITTKIQKTDEKHEDKELDNVLKVVNQKVKDADKEEKDKSDKKLLKKDKTPKVHNEIKRPVLTTVTAILVAAGLAAAAFYAFHNEPAKVQTSSAAQTAKTATSGSQTTTADITSTSSALDSGLSGLNDGQDFSADELSDKNLGLQ